MFYYEVFYFSYTTAMAHVFIKEGHVNVSDPCGTPTESSRSCYCVPLYHLLFFFSSSALNSVKKNKINKMQLISVLPRSCKAQYLNA